MVVLMSGWPCARMRRAGFPEGMAKRPDPRGTAFPRAPSRAPRGGRAGHPPAPGRAWLGGVGGGLASRVRRDARGPLPPRRRTRLPAGTRRRCPRAARARAPAGRGDGATTTGRPAGRCPAGTSARAMAGVRDVPRIVDGALPRTARSPHQVLPVGRPAAALLGLRFAWAAAAAAIGYASAARRC